MLKAADKIQRWLYHFFRVSCSGCATAFEYQGGLTGNWLFNEGQRVWSHDVTLRFWVLYDWFKFVGFHRVNHLIYLGQIKFGGLLRRQLSSYGFDGLTDQVWIRVDLASGPSWVFVIRLICVQNWRFARYVLFDNKFHFFFFKPQNSPGLPILL